VAKLKKFTLSDGSVTDCEKVARIVGITLKNSRVRLAQSSDPERVYMKKQVHSRTHKESYMMRSILNREASMYNEMFKLVFKTI
jgi:hypothetical protein